VTGWVILLLWLVGFVATIHPLQRALLRAAMRQAAKRRGRVDTFEVVTSAIWAVVLSLGWFVALPFFISRVIHGRGKFEIEHEIDTIAAEVQLDVQRRAELKAAAKEVDVVDHEARRIWG
jgi:hypothetical protein